MLTGVKLRKTYHGDEQQLVWERYGLGDGDVCGYSRGIGSGPVYSRGVAIVFFRRTVMPRLPSEIAPIILLRR